MSHPADDQSPRAASQTRGSSSNKVGTHSELCILCFSLWNHVRAAVSPYLPANCSHEIEHGAHTKVADKVASSTKIRKCGRPSANRVGISQILKCAVAVLTLALN